MPKAPLPENDEARVAALAEYGIQPGVIDEALDGVARAASRALGVPMALVTLVDRGTQNLPGAYGWTYGRVTSREAAFCGYTILDDQILEVGDALSDRRFSDNVLVNDEPYLRFYAGAPLITAEGYRLGSVCGLDTQPRELATWQRETLRDLAQTVIDILEGYRYQNQLLAKKQQSDRLLALGQLSAGMAHEINNALQPLVGMASVLKDRAEAGTRMRRLLTTMEDSAVYARDVVADVLAFARQDAGDVRSQDIVAVLQDAVTFVGRLMPANVKIVTDGLEAVRADGWGHHVRLSHQGAVQVIQNLVRNAADAMNDHGTVMLRLERDELADRDGASKPAVVLTVADEAPPIDDETRERMFDPFFTTKPVNEGSGLGLPTVLGLVEGWGGRIDVTSTESGNRFAITLPLAAAPEA
jgi:signal transduction histidine kinase